MSSILLSSYFVNRRRWTRQALAMLEVKKAATLQAESGNGNVLFEYLHFPFRVSVLL